MKFSLSTLNRLLSSSKLLAAGLTVLAALSVSTPVEASKKKLATAPSVGEVLDIPLERPDTIVSWVNPITESEYLLNVYYPENISPGQQGPLPTIVMLGAYCLGNTNYTEFSKELASWGFIVATPNLVGEAPGFTDTAIALPDQYEVDDVLAMLDTLNEDDSSPLYGLVDTSNVGLCGHSLGGVMQLFSLGGYTFPGFPGPTPYQMPSVVKAVAVNAAGTVSQFTPFGIPIDQQGIPCAFIQGGMDTMNTVANVQTTIDLMTNGENFLIIVPFAEHFSITDSGLPYTCAPVGAKVKAVKQKAVKKKAAANVPHSVALRDIAKFTALFFRSYLNNSDAAFKELTHTKASKKSVSVTYRK